MELSPEVKVEGNMGTQSHGTSANTHSGDSLTQQPHGNDGGHINHENVQIKQEHQNENGEISNHYQQEMKENKSRSRSPSPTSGAEFALHLSPPLPMDEHNNIRAANNEHDHSLNDSNVTHLNEPKMQIDRHLMGARSRSQSPAPAARSRSHSPQNRERSRSPPLISNRRSPSPSSKDHNLDLNEPPHAKNDAHKSGSKTASSLSRDTNNGIVGENSVNDSNSPSSAVSANSTGAAKNDQQQQKKEKYEQHTKTKVIEKH